MFCAPPLTEDQSPLAVLTFPPLTEEPEPLAMCWEPPLTEEPEPLAMFRNPLLTEANSPLAVLPANRVKILFTKMGSEGDLIGSANSIQINPSLLMV